jgi:hypothetical protein
VVSVGDRPEEDGRDHYQIDSKADMRVRIYSGNPVVAEATTS